jgi:hypothetical protein
VFAHGSTIRKRRLWDSGVAVKAYALARRVAESVGLQIVVKTYYSPIPDLATLPNGIWDEADPLRGIDFDLDAQIARMEGRLAALFAEFTRAAPGDRTYEDLNASLPVPDARLLYALVRDLRPKAIVELGSGQTSRVIAQACRANMAEGAKTSYRAFDPFPIGLDGALPGLSALERIPAQDVPESVFAELAAGDILFVDTTHTVKIGSDVNRIVLRILPMLAPGVIVHFHDICIPYEYPRYLFEDYALYWAEQYLLQAFLSMNTDYEILFAAAALCRDRPMEVERLGLAGAGGESGSSFWIRRR